MVRADVIKLIAESPAAHGVYDETTRTARTVMCTVRAASYRDIEAAGSEGLRLSLIHI